MTKYEASLVDHQTYQSAMADWTDWLQSIHDRVDVCQDATGDIHSVQNQIDRLKVKHALLIVFVFQNLVTG